MDDVGRLWFSALIFFAALLLMFFVSLCGNSVLNLSDADAESLFGSGKSRKAKRLLRLHTDPDIITQTNLAVRTLLIIAVSAVFTDCLFKPLFAALRREIADYSVFTAVFVAVSVVIIAVCSAIVCAFGVSIPKRLCISGKVGDKFVKRSFGIYSLVLSLFRPMQVLVSGVTGLVLRLNGIKKKDLEEQVTEQEILEMLDAANEKGGIEDDQAEMISNIFEFSDTELHEVMTHRTEICAAEDTATVSEVVNIAVETGVSRIPVYHETIDDICGVIYVKDLLPIILKPEDSAKSVTEFLHTVKFMPESGSCDELFNYFMENNKQIAVLLDEYGGTAGIVTMEDLLESIVGNIRDEYDENETEDIEEITPHTFDIQGGADPDEVMEALDCALPDDKDFDTMGGFVTDLLGYIPEDGQTPTVRYKNVTFAVIKAKDNRIERIRAVKDVKKAALDNEE